MFKLTATILPLAMALLSAAPAGAIPSEADEAHAAQAKALEVQAAIDILAYYPAPAKAAGIEGTARLHCDLSEHGAYRNCALISESPPHQFFGLAALNIARASVENPALKLFPADRQWGRDLDFKFSLSPPAITPNILAPPRLAPKWVATPSGSDFAVVYPPGAEARSEAGRAVVRCFAGADGALARCDILDETPPGEGFGAAALRLMYFFRFAPTNPDGLPTEGYEVIVPIKFLPAPR